MKVISLNSGSSSVKIKLFIMPSEEVIMDASYERVGFDNSFVTYKFNGKKQTIEFERNLSHKQCIKRFFNFLINEEIIENYDDIKCVGHRVVMGADYFPSSVIINSDVESKIESLYDLAPLHNPHNHEGIKAIKEISNNIIQVACFDTAFHQSMSDLDRVFPIDFKYFKQGIKRYGAHGISVNYIVNEYANFKNISTSDVNVIVCHLGSGSSITSVENGKSVDTSMGYSPLGGIMMGTRSGDLDPSVVLKLLEIEGDVNKVNNILNKNSGLLGVSEISNDLRDILSTKENNKQAKLAYDLFIKRVAEKIGSYAIKQENLDAIILTAGIGENSFDVQHDLQKYLKNIGFVPGQTKVNKAWSQFSDDNSKLSFYAKTTNEELMIARDCLQLIMEDSNGF